MKAAAIAAAFLWALFGGAANAQKTVSAELFSVLLYLIP
ncbi:hypothetical protein J3A98_002411 [Pseudomonas sp. BP6]|nr:hypothetical protein [Pseudomonas sp. BP6]MBP2289311.1 hypothetical protein [Pseudomonas sp. BP7]